MLNYTIGLLRSEGIELVKPIPLNKCAITKEYLLEKAGITDGTAIMFAMPYLSENCTEHNISLYAVPMDYHYYFSGLKERIIPKLKERFPEKKIEMFTDHSPFDERDAAALAGLGVIGKNQMLITDRYSSYVFIGEIVTDLIIDCPDTLDKPSYCIGCGKCLKECPINNDGIMCLSAVTQKKGELTEEEKRAMIKYGCAWGCDICQEVCPYTLNAKKSKTIYTKIPFFNTDLTPVLSYRSIENMPDEDFKKRAYAWRKKETILRNLDLLGYK